MPSVLKELRDRAGWTQQELADKTGLYQESIARIESGRVQMSVDTALKIAPVLEEAIEEPVDPLVLMGKKISQKLQPMG